MGAKARQARQRTERRVRVERLTAEERAFLRDHARYEGSPLHKRNPGDFGLTPPSSPRPEKTLCDEAGVFKKSAASELLAAAIEGGLVCDGNFASSFPKQLWVVHDGRVFEAMHGGSQAGCYHGYPIRKSDPLSDEVLALWNAA